MATLFEKQNEEQEEDKKQEESKSASKEEQMKGVAEVYGISLADIEEVRLPNGKEYFKFYNPQDRSMKMIENRRDGKNLSEQFKEIQKTLSASQGEDSLANARAVFDYQLKYENVELSLIPVSELKGNASSYRHQLDGLDAGERKAVRVLLENIDYLNLEYINIQNALGIDKDGRVITANYNYQTGKCELKAAEIKNYETNKMSSDSDMYTFDITEEEFDQLVGDIDVSSDTPVVVQEEEEIQGKEQSSVRRGSTRGTVMVRGMEINLLLAIQYYQYPELLARSELSEPAKMVYQGIARAIIRKKAKKNAMTKNKQYVLRQNHNNNNNSQAAFVDGILLVLVSGFCAGMLIMFLMMM